MGRGDKATPSWALHPCSCPCAMLPPEGWKRSQEPGTQQCPLARSDAPPAPAPGPGPTAPGAAQTVCRRHHTHRAGGDPSRPWGPPCCTACKTGTNSAESRGHRGWVEGWSLFTATAHIETCPQPWAPAGPMLWTEINTLAAFHVPPLSPRFWAGAPARLQWSGRSLPGSLSNAGCIHLHTLGLTLQGGGHR